MIEKLGVIMDDKQKQAILRYEAVAFLAILAVFGAAKVSSSYQW